MEIIEFSLQVGTLFREGHHVEQRPHPHRTPAQSFHEQHIAGKGLDVPAVGHSVETGRQQPIQRGLSLGARPPNARHKFRIFHKPDA